MTRKPTVTVKFMGEAGVYNRLPVAQKYLLLVEGPSYTGVLEFQGTKGEVTKALYRPSMKSWMAKATGMLGESLTLRVLPIQARQDARTLPGVVAAEVPSIQVAETVYDEGDAIRAVRGLLHQQAS